jgi:hypothetical protein
MCNRCAADIRKADKERDYYGFHEWSEIRINPILGKPCSKSSRSARRVCIEPVKSSVLEAA